MLKIFKILAVLLFVGSILLPQFSFAATSSLNIYQQAGDVVPDPGGSGGGGSIDRTPPQITDVIIRVKTDSVTVTWNTNEVTSSKFSWGESTEYRDGLLYSQNLTITHSAELVSLKEKTLYYFLITGFDNSGNQGFYEGQFITGSSPDVTPPLNVTEFSARPTQSTIELSWNNPSDQDFAFTRIVRSSTFFPLDPLNGEVVYEGSAQQFIDRDVVAGTLYSYTAFTRDLTGNFSSGSLASAMIAWYSESPDSGQDPELPITDLKFIYSKDIPRIFLNQHDFSYSYNQGKIILPSNNIRVPSLEPLTITIPKSKVPTGTQFLLLQNQESKYLFFYNLETNNYQVTIPNIGKVGTHNLIVSLFNSAKEIIQDVPIVVTVEQSPQIQKGLRQMISDKIFGTRFPLMWLVIIIVIAILVVRFLWKVRARR